MARAALADAANIYTGDLLPDCQNAWMQTERAQLRRIFVDVLERLVELLEQQREYGIAVRYARRLRDLDPSHESTFQRLVHHIQAIAAYLHSLTTAQPLVLLLNDLPWANQDSLDLLDYVTRRIESQLLRILATYRSEEVQRAHPLHAFLPVLQRDRPVESIRLAPLDLDGTTRLIEGYLGPCNPRLARYLHDRAEGYPLFLT